MIKGINYTGITVVFVCHDDEGRILMNKRSINCRDEKEKWDIGGGSLDFGEDVIETLKREIMEEYSTDVIEYEFLGYRDVHRKNDGIQTHWLALDFRVLVDKEKVLVGEPHKFDEIGWYYIDNLPTPLHSQLEYTLAKNIDKLSFLKKSV